MALAFGCATVRGPSDEFRAEGEPLPTLTPYEVAEPSIIPSDVERHVRFLAADERQGRAPGSEGLERAAAWVAAEFSFAGLDPAGDHGGYLQYWPYEDGARTAGADSTVQVPNVVARVSGGDTTRAGEYVVLVAHYDHLGVGKPTEDGDSIYNGADDNASGVAALVELADAVGAVSGQLSRPILFLAVSGAGDGRGGARWFADHPTVGLSDAVAVLDLDMIGRNASDSIGILGSDSLAALIDRLAAETHPLGLSVTRDPAGAADVAPGGYTVFADRGIPAVRFFSGLHEDYHTPSDEAGAVKPDKIARVARLAFLAVHHLATQQE